MTSTEELNIVVGTPVPRSERVAQERLELKEWAKTTPDHLRQDQAEDRVFPSQNHMNMEELICEMGLHFLYDWEGVYTPEKRSEIIRMHADNYDWHDGRPRQRQRLLRRHGRGVRGGRPTDSKFLDTVITDLHFSHCGSDGRESISTTFEQFELSLPSNGLKNKLMALINSSQWVEHTYVQTDKLKYDDIAAMCWDCGEYNGSAESPGDPIFVHCNFAIICGDIDDDESHYVLDLCGAVTDLEIEERIRQDLPNVFNETSDDSDDSDEEEEMSEQERKEMCSKSLEILESIMETDDQRMGEGKFVELCNLFKELHKT